MKYLNLLMLPTDYCNMRCKYCFFNKEIQPKNKMNIEVLQHLMDITLPFYERVTFIWHGGEPLSMGLDFYQNVISIQNQYKKQYNVKIYNSIQSNFTLLTKEMVSFFLDKGFGLSTSYDGINNEITRGNSSQIIAGMNKCFEANMKYGVIMIASKLNIHTLIESYELFKSKGIGFKVNPYLGIDQQLVLDYNVYTASMKELFKYWALDTDTDIQVSSFNAIVDYILLQKKKLCTYTSCLGKWASVDYKGTIKPCNRYFPDEYSFGNIMDYSSFDEAFNSEGFRNLIIQAISRRENCKECEIFDFCSGGCNYVTMTENGGIENNNGKYCIYLKEMYRYIRDFLKDHENDQNLNKYLKATLSKRFKRDIKDEILDNPIK